MSRRDGQTHSARPVRAIGAAALLALIVFFLYVGLAHIWDSRGAFGQHDVLFDADVKTRLACFADGWDRDGRNTKHPNLCNLVNPPIRVFAALFSGAEDQAQLRRSLALWVAPLAAALNVALCFLAALRMGASTARAMALALILAGSFSLVLFGSVPDHLALGGMTIALAASAYVNALAGRQCAVWLWHLLGWLAASITVTNVLPVAMFYGASLIAVREPWLRAVGKTSLLLLLALATAFGSALLLNAGYGIHGMDVFMPRAGVGPLKEFPLQNLLDFPWRVLQSFAPSEYRIIPNGMSSNEPHQYIIQFSMENFSIGQGGQALAWVLLMLIAMAIFQTWRKRSKPRQFMVTMCLAVAFHGVLHARFGSDIFLYSAHWLFPTVLLLADGWGGEDVEADKRWQRLYTVALWIFALLLAINSAHLVRSMVSDLDINRLVLVPT